MNSFAKFLIDRWKPDAPPGIIAREGTYWSTLTGQDPPYLEVDWIELQQNIEVLEAEFKAMR